MSGFTSSTNPSSSPQFSVPPPSSSSSSLFSSAFAQQPSSSSPFSISKPNHSFGAPPSSAPSYGFGFAPSSPPISSAFGSSGFSSTSSGFSKPSGASQPLLGATSSSASSSPFRSSNLFGANSSIPIPSTTISSLFGSSSNSSTTSLFGLSSSSSVSSGTTYTTAPLSSALFGSSYPSSATTSSLFGSSSNSRTTSLFGFSSSSSVSSGTTYTTAPLSSALFGSSSPSSATATLASSTSTTVSSTTASSPSAPVVSSPLAAEPDSTLESPAFGASSSSTTDSTVATTGCQDSIGGSPVCSTISFKLAVSDDEEGFGNEDEQVNYRALEQTGVQMPECETKKEVPGVTQDQEKRDAITMKVASVHDSIQRAEPPAIGGVVVTSSMVVSSGAALATVPVVEASSIKMDIPDVKSAATDVRVTLPAKELEIGKVDSCENPSAVSEIVAGYELKPPGVGSLISPIAEMTDSNELSLSPHYGLIIEQISSKYGDITKGSILKSMAAKFPFLQLVAHIVHLLSNHTLDTLGSNELELIRTWTADAAAVGFQVDWLQQRVNQVTEATKYRGLRVELDELGKQIDATIKCLMEMEFREMVCKEKLASIKAEMEGNDFGGSVLSTGLL